jgi:Domain of unknown function (DUF4267)
VNIQLPGNPGDLPVPLPSCSRISSTIFTARSRSSSGYLFCAAMALHPPRNQSLQGSRGDPPYLSVKGVRDIASGLIAVILLAARMPHVLGWFELAASTIPIGDAIIVLRSNGPKATVYVVHGATAVVLLATAALLFT